MTDLPDIGSLVEQHQKLRRHLDAQELAFKEYCKPYREQMEKLEAEISAAMHKAGMKSVKTEFGTPILSEITTPRIKTDERDGYIDWCMENWSTYGGQMLQIGAPQVTAVREYMDKNEGRLPPHIEISTALRFSIRKAG